MDRDQLVEYIINPVLKKINLHSPEAVDLLLGTCQHESHLGKYIHQIRGPALGIYQCEPKTHDDIWDNYLKYHPGLSSKIKSSANINVINSDSLINNLSYATAIARVHYLRVKKPIPVYQGNRSTYLYELSSYYKEYYNTRLGAATIEGAVLSFDKVV